MTERYDGDDRESRTAFRAYDSVSEPVSSRTAWQIWRDACAWQAARATPADQLPKSAHELIQLFRKTMRTHDTDLADLLESKIHALYAERATPADHSDAYTGAREDLAIWKKRALEAEELNRKFMHEINGPTFMGEPTAHSLPVAIYQIFDSSYLMWLDVTKHVHDIYENEKRRIVYASPQNAADHIDAQSVRDAWIHTCGLPMSVNPHPEAGVPGRYLETGCQRECIPCLVLSRHQWSKRAVNAEKELRDLKSAPPQKPVSDEVMP